MAFEGSDEGAIKFPELCRAIPTGGSNSLAVGTEPHIPNRGRYGLRR